MLRFCLLGSGSKGNATFIATPTARILIDNGLSFLQLRKRLESVGESVEDVSAVFITHEHGDHVRGIGTLARKLNVPVFMTSRTYDSLPKGVGQLPRAEVFNAGDRIAVDGITVSSFSVSHDAADPVAYIVESGGAKLGMAHDLGHVSELVRVRLADSHALVLESNYCPDMLHKGPYPPMIKQRIRGKHGHLSNSDMSSLLANLLHDDLQVVVLVHMSEENNCEETARAMAAKVVGSRDVRLHLALQDHPTPVFEIVA